MKRAATVLLACSAAVLAASCGEAEAARPDAGLQVVATTPVAADLVRNAAGSGTEVRSLLDPRTDPHEYELRPRDVEALAGADLVVRSGGELDQWLGEAIEAAGADAPVLSLIDVIDPLIGGRAVPDEDAEGGAQSEDQVDPHWWHDPGNAAKAVVAIRDEVAELRGGGGGERPAAAAYLRRLDELTRDIETCVARIPRGSRKLVTTHDSLGYFARRFGFEVVGAVIPSLSTAGQASAGETDELVETIRRERVAAVFAEQSVSADVERAIAEEAGATVGDPLWTDTLGPPGSGAETYVAAVAQNTRAIVKGLTAGRETCSAPS